MATRSKRLFDPTASEPFALSRTKIQDFIDCPRCFWLDRRCGISKPSMPAFSLNIAVDSLLKREFDAYRSRGEPHPIMIQYGINAVPYQHPELETWRNNFKGVRHHDQPSNIILYGAVDDIWVEASGDLIVVDFKATASQEKNITLESPYRQRYKTQLEIYQWLLQQCGFKVSSRAFILYCNANKDRDAFDGRLEFSTQLIEHTGDFSLVGNMLHWARVVLMLDTPPAPAPECEWCKYRTAQS